MLERSRADVPCAALTPLPGPLQGVGADLAPGRKPWPLLTAQPVHLSSSGQGPAPSLSSSWHLRSPASDTSPRFCWGTAEIVMPWGP